MTLNADARCYTRLDKLRINVEPMKFRVTFMSAFDVIMKKISLHCLMKNKKNNHVITLKLSYIHE